MTRHLELRDLRSLERPSMYKIFAPLDPDERLPRELLFENRRHRLVGRPEVAGALWLPVLWLILLATGWMDAGTMVVLGIISLAFVGFSFLAWYRNRA
jgi:hypothetical protein